MTWVVGGNCFNGFVCVADIQVTIEFKDKTSNKYFNCVQKIHKVYDNLCVAFSGDIRSGLIIIEDLQKNLKKQINEGEYFDIDGQSKVLVDYLKDVYEKINGTQKPALELMFLWNAQEGGDAHYRSFLMTFKSPSFNINSTKMLSACQSGGGKRDKQYDAISSLLSGYERETKEFDVLRGELENSPGIWTVEKFKNLVFEEASKVSFPGVSKTLMSFESVIDFKNIYPDWIQKTLRNTFEELGVEYSSKKTANHSVNVTSMDLSKMDEVINHLKNNEPQQLEALMSVLNLALQNQDLTSICKLPNIVSSYKLSKGEEIHSKKLFTKWDELRQFLGLKGVNVKACSAIAA